MRLNRAMRRSRAALAAVAGLALLAGCSQAGQGEAEARNPAPATPEATGAASEAPEEPEETESDEPSEMDQYLHDLRNPMQFGDLTLGGEYYADVSDSDLLRAGYVVCDYIDGDDATGDYQVDLAFASIFHFPESVKDAEDGNHVRLAAAAAVNFCPEHVDPMLEDFQDAAGNG